MTGLTSAWGGAEGVALESSAACTTAARKKMKERKERAENRRKPPDMSTSNKAKKCIAQKRLAYQKPTQVFGSWAGGSYGELRRLPARKAFNREERRGNAEFAENNCANRGTIGGRFSGSRAGCYHDGDHQGRAPNARPTTLLSSSMAEHSAVNRRVVGSSPT